MSITEMLVSATLLTILTAVSAPSWIDFTERQAVRSAASQVQSALSLAKSETGKTTEKHSIYVCNTSKGMEYLVTYTDDSQGEWQHLEDASVMSATLPEDTESARDWNAINPTCWQIRNPRIESQSGAGIGFLHIVPLSYYKRDDEMKKPTYCRQVGYNTLIGNVENRQCDAK